MALVNAAYFKGINFVVMISILNILACTCKFIFCFIRNTKGQWSSQFQANETKMDNFYVKRDKIRATKFMKQQGQFNYYPSEELRAHVLQVI